MARLCRRKEAGGRKAKLNMRKGVRTFTDDRVSDLRWGVAFLGALLALLMVGVVGLPLLILLLLLFLFNPVGMGERVGRCRWLKRVPGFRSGHRARMALATFCYLLPPSLLGMIVVDVDALLLRGWLGL